MLRDDLLKKEMNVTVPARGGSSRFGARCVITIALIGTTAHGESFAPYTNERYVDECGNFYVAVKRLAGGERYRQNWEPVELTIAKRGPSTTPVLPVRPNMEISLDGVRVVDMQAGNAVDVRKGDIVLGRAKVTHPPSTVLVSSTGLGVVLLDLYGLNFTLLTRGDAALTLLSLNGQTRFTKKLTDLFQPKVVSGFACTMSNCPGWLRAAWIDEENRELVVVGANSTNSINPLSIVKLDTGTVRVGTNQDILRAIVSRNPVDSRPR
jgi:hypothetical protein